MSPSHFLASLGLSEQSIALLCKSRLEDQHILAMASRADLQGIGLPLGDIFRIQSSVSVPPTTLHGDGATEDLAKEANADPPPNARFKTALDEILGCPGATNPRPETTQALGDNHKGHLGGPFLVSDFVECLVQEDSEESIFTSEGAKLILRQKKKLKLENLSAEDWQTGCLNILRALIIRRGLSSDGVLAYTDYLVKLAKFSKKFDFEGLKKYDHEYRKLQYEKGFAWNSEENCAYLASLYLTPKADESPKRKSTSDKKQPPRLRSTKKVCFKFNSKSGCDADDCPYRHTCAEKDCDEKHPSFSHPKN